MIGIQLDLDSLLDTSCGSSTNLQHDASLSLSDQVMEQMHQGNLMQAKELCEQMITDSCSDPDGIYLLGLIAMQEKDYVQAVDYFSQAIKYQTDDASMYFNLGQALLLSRQYSLAEKAYAQALLLMPDMLQAQLGLGQVLAYLGKYDDALQYLRRVIVKQSMLSADDTALAMMHKGMLYEGLGKHQKALWCFEQAVSLNPNLAPADYGRASALRSLGRLAEAEQNINQVLIQDMQYASAYFLFGTLLEKSRQYTEALLCFDRAILLAPEFLDAVGARKRILLRFGLHNQAG